jgi:Caspase domain
LDRPDIDCEYVKSDNGVWFSQLYKRLFQRDDFGRSVALVVGIGAYDSYPLLSVPVNDALRMREFLVNEAGFDRVVVLTDAAASSDRINKLLETDLPNSLGEHDRFLFYFSGHGDTRNLGGDKKRGYLVLKPAPDKGWDKMIDMQRLHHYAENFGLARHVLFVFDACFSGFAGFQLKGNSGDPMIDRLSQPAHQMITAGTEDEESYSTEQGSLFTSVFLAAARDEYGEVKDGVISMDEIMPRIRDRLDFKRQELGDTVKMTPQNWRIRTENNAGEFFFIRHPNVTRASGNGPSQPAGPPPSTVESKSGERQQLPDENDETSGRIIGNI